MGVYSLFPRGHCKPSQEIFFFSRTLSTIQLLYKQCWIVQLPSAKLGMPNQAFCSWRRWVISPQELCIISAAGVLKWSIEPTAVRVLCSWIRSLGSISDKRIVTQRQHPTLMIFHLILLIKYFSPIYLFFGGGGYFEY